jgi:hypothetical protein
MVKHRAAAEATLSAPFSRFFSDAASSAEAAPSWIKPI